MKSRAATPHLALLLVLGMICSGCPRPPCPPRSAPLVIPTPPPVQLPTVTVPEPDSSGRYCLTPEQLQALADGIRALRTSDLALREAIRIANSAAEAPR